MDSNYEYYAFLNLYRYLNKDIVFAIENMLNIEYFSDMFVLNFYLDTSSSNKKL